MSEPYKGVPQDYAEPRNPLALVTDSELTALTAVVHVEAITGAKLGPNYSLLCEILKARGLDVEPINRKCSNCGHPRTSHYGDKQCIACSPALTNCQRFLP